MSVTGEHFKAVFRKHPARVALVVRAGTHEPVGLTVSSVASVSARPPMVSFSLSQNASAVAEILASSNLDVVLLGEHQAAVAADFATRGAARFTAAQGWRERVIDDTGRRVLFLESAPATLHIHLVEVILAGDSWLVLAEVTGIEDGPDRAPLVYYDRSYWPAAQDGIAAVGAAAGASTDDQPFE